jgi:hypothetical protein
MRDKIIRLASIAISGCLLLVAMHGTASAGEAVAPEFDPGMISGGLALLATGGALVIERLRRR